MMGCSGYSQKAGSDSTFQVGVAFNSMCCGVPSETPMKLFIDSFKLKYDIPEILATRIGPLGREGEYRLGFGLSEMNALQKKEFISGLSNIQKLKDDPGSIRIVPEMRIVIQELPPRARFKEIRY